MLEPNAPTRDRLGIAGLGIVGAGSALANFSIITPLAIAAGVPSAVGWAYWVILDFFALVAMRAALRARTDAVRRSANLASVLALLLAAGAAALHVFIDNGQLPQWASAAILALPALMLGLSFHLVVLMAHEGRGTAGTQDASTHREVEEDATPVTVDELVVTETHQRQVTSRRTSKTSAFRERLIAEVDPEDPRSNADIAREINANIGLHDTNARQLVAQLRKGELS